MSITKTGRLFEDVLSRAIADVRGKGIDVFTFAFYHDHESAAVSVCVDTESSSKRLVVSQNIFRLQQFAAPIAKCDLRKAKLWNANTGRSLSLGDFALINVSRTNLGPIRPGPDFYVTMARCLRSFAPDIIPLASDPQRLLFCCSSADDEVGYMWSADPVAE
jgi:hypothetical protein